MSLVDRTNENIELSLHVGEGVEDGGRASLEADIDHDSSSTPSMWVWLMFSTDNEPWFKLTLEETERLYDRLGRILGVDHA